jgi:hypothetical protein
MPRPEPTPDTWPAIPGTITYGQIRTTSGDVLAEITFRTPVTPSQAISRLGRKGAGYSRIGLSQHFGGGSTWHVQYATGGGRDGSSISLSGTYVLRLDELER